VFTTRLKRGYVWRAFHEEVNYLNAIMHNKYARHPEKLRAWQSASRVERAPQRQKQPAAVVINTSSATVEPKAA